MAKEKPILFSGEMVRAILSGRKTQTRRVVNPQPVRDECAWACYFDRRNAQGLYDIPAWKLNDKPNDAMLSFCPYGQPGDRLWVRETWGLFDTEPIDGPENAHVYYRATDGERHELRYQLWRPSIFMPRWASRITLEVTGVRVERVQEISDRDLRADFCPSTRVWESFFDSFVGWDNQKKWCREFWDSINAKRGYSWESNPWCWVIEFKKHPA